MNPKSIFLLIISINVVLLGIISYFGYTYWWSIQQPRIALAERLGLLKDSNWDTLNHHVDCILVKNGMPPQIVETTLARELGAVALNPPRRVPDDNFDLVFPDTGLQRRRYYFENERLSQIYLFEEANLDTDYTLVECDTTP